MIFGFHKCSIPQHQQCRISEIGASAKAGNVEFQKPEHLRKLVIQTSDRSSLHSQQDHLFRSRVCAMTLSDGESFKASSFPFARKRDYLISSEARIRVTDTRNRSCGEEASIAPGLGALRDDSLKRFPARSNFFCCIKKMAFPWNHAIFYSLFLDYGLFSDVFKFCKLHYTHF